MQRLVEIDESHEKNGKELKGHLLDAPSFAPFFPFLSNTERKWVLRFLVLKEGGFERVGKSCMLKI